MKGSRVQFWGLSFFKRLQIVEMNEEVIGYIYLELYITWNYAYSWLNLLLIALDTCLTWWREIECLSDWLDVVPHRYTCKMEYTCYMMEDQVPCGYIHIYYYYEELGTMLVWYMDEVGPSELWWLA